MSEELKNYDSSTIETLDWYTHIRTRPGMYIGYAGDGSMPDDGLYVLVKEVIDNSIDEYASGFGKEIIITVDGRRVTVRDFGRGVPLEKVVDVSSKLMTGGKFDSGVFKKSVGLNGIGIKAVNATSIYFQITSYRDGKFRSATYSKGILDKDESGDSGEKNGTMVSFIADDSVFHNYSYNMEFIETMVRNYAYLNTGLTLKLNGTVYHSANGLLDLVNETPFTSRARTSSASSHTETATGRTSHPLSMVRTRLRAVHISPLSARPWPRPSRSISRKTSSRRMSASR